MTIMKSIRCEIVKLNSSLHFFCHFLSLLLMILDGFATQLDNFEQGIELQLFWLKG
jgi:hypothetical protein